MFLTHTRFLLPVYGAGLIAAALAVSPASATVIVDDSFADADFAKTGALDTNWWTSSSSSGKEISAGSLGLVTGTSGRGIHTVFGPVSLSNVGDKLVVSYAFTTPATVAGGSGKSSSFKVGLFDSLGQAGLDADVSASSGTPNPLYGYGLAFGGPGTLALPGFLMDMDVNTGATADLNFREHVSNTVTGTGRLMGTNTNFSSISPSGPDAGYTFDPNTAYTGSLTIERISATELQYTGTLGGDSYTNIDSTIDSDTFDFLGFHVNSNVFGSTNAQNTPDNGIDFSNIRIEFIPVPEPASLALLGLGGLAMLRRRA